MWIGLQVRDVQEWPNFDIIEPFDATAIVDFDIGKARLQASSMAKSQINPRRGVDMRIVMMIVFISWNSSADECFQCGLHCRLKHVVKKV